MNPCLSKIVGICRDCAENTGASLSGHYLFDAPEITTGNLADTATENYTSGMALAKRKLEMAVTQVENDFLSVLRANGVMARMDEITYNSSEFQPTSSMGLAPKQRGVTLVKSTKIRGRLRKVVIREVECYPMQDATAVSLYIYDESGKKYTYTVNLVAGQINAFPINYTVQGKWARVVFDNTALAFASAPVTCFEGCNGNLPNDCGYARGYDGTSDIKKGDGYGINLRFACACDYSQLLCDMAKSQVGELIYTQARILLLEEHIHSNRLTNWIVYDRKRAKEHKAELEGLYVERWNTLVSGMDAILKTYHDDCLSCKGIKWVVNL